MNRSGHDALTDRAHPSLLGKALKPVHATGPEPCILPTKHTKGSPGAQARTERHGSSGVGLGRKQHIKIGSVSKLLSLHKLCLAYAGSNWCSTGPYIQATDSGTAGRMRAATVVSAPVLRAFTHSSVRRFGLCCSLRNRVHGTPRVQPPHMAPQGFGPCWASHLDEPSNTEPGAGTYSYLSSGGGACLKVAICGQPNTPAVGLHAAAPHWRARA